MAEEGGIYRGWRAEVEGKAVRWPAPSVVLQTQWTATAFVGSAVRRSGAHHSHGACGAGNQPDAAVVAGQRWDALRGFWEALLAYAAGGPCPTFP